MTEITAKSVAFPTAGSATEAASGRTAPIEAPPRGEREAPCDFRFRALLNTTAWSGLPAEVRKRFSERLCDGASVTYAGKIVGARRTWTGLLLAQLCRLIGAPLPLSRDVGTPAVVTVAEDPATGGQFWTRIYGRRRGFPQVIHSSKRFAGPTGLEEYLGCGFGIALRASADHRALHFHSDHYFLAFGPLRWRLPSWLGPGDLTISHVELGKGAFLFVLTLRHARFGEIIKQTGIFREHRAPSSAEHAHD